MKCQDLYNKNLLAIGPKINRNLCRIIYLDKFVTFLSYLHTRPACHYCKYRLFSVLLIKTCHNMILSTVAKMSVLNILKTKPEHFYKNLIIFSFILETQSSWRYPGSTNPCFLCLLFSLVGVIGLHLDSCYFRSLRTFRCIQIDVREKMTDT